MINVPIQYGIDLHPITLKAYNKLFSLSKIKVVPVELDRKQTAIILKIIESMFENFVLPIIQNRLKTSKLFFVLYEKKYPNPTIISGNRKEIKLPLFCVNNLNLLKAITYI